MPVTNVLVDSGQSVSGAFTLPAADRPLAVMVPSLNAAGAIRFEFTVPPWEG